MVGNPDTAARFSTGLDPDSIVNGRSTIRPIRCLVSHINGMLKLRDIKPDVYLRIQGNPLCGDSQNTLCRLHESAQAAVELPQRLA